MRRLWQLFEGILFRYADGFVRAGASTVAGKAPVGMGYGDAWLTSVGYRQGAAFDSDAVLPEPTRLDPSQWPYAARDANPGLSPCCAPLKDQRSCPCG